MLWVCHGGQAWPASCSAAGPANHSQPQAPQQMQPAHVRVCKVGQTLPLPLQLVLDGSDLCLCSGEGLLQLPPLLHQLLPALLLQFALQGSVSAITKGWQVPARTWHWPDHIMRCLSLQRPVLTASRACRADAPACCRPADDRSPLSAWQWRCSMESAAFGLQDPCRAPGRCTLAMNTYLHAYHSALMCQGPAWLHTRANADQQGYDKRSHPTQLKRQSATRQLCCNRPRTC